MAGSLKTVIPADAPGSDLFGRPPGRVVRCAGCLRNAEEYEAGRCWLCCHAGDVYADPPAGKRGGPRCRPHPGLVESDGGVIWPPPGWGLADWLAHLDGLGERAKARVCVRTGRPVGRVPDAPAPDSVGPVVCHWCGGAADRVPSPGGSRGSKSVPAGWVRRCVGRRTTGLTTRACCPACWADAPGKGTRTDLAGRAG